MSLVFRQICNDFRLATFSTKSVIQRWGVMPSRPRAQGQQAELSFFVTSVGKGNGADLGGLAGADAHCQALAKAAGSTETNWRAYLSIAEPGGVAGVNARDRIGKGPWQNAKGIVVAKSVEDLHSRVKQHQQTDCSD
jgi:hypothetical protein